MNFDDFLRSKGFADALGLPLDGTYQRFDRAGDNTGWLIGTTHEFQGKTYISAFFGDWKSEEKYSYDDESVSLLTDAERAEYKTVREKTQRKVSAEKLKQQEETAIKSQAEWANLSDRGESPYFNLKGLSGLHGCKLSVQETTTLTVVPLRDIHGKLWGLQRIRPDKEKRFVPGTKKKGNFHTLGTLKNEGEIYVCEGITTAISIHTALGGVSPVVSAFDKGNLEPVCKLLHEAYPLGRIIICADDDGCGAPLTRVGGRALCTAQHPDAHGGIRSARCAARVVGGGVRWPLFSSPTPSQTDFDDLRQAEGLEQVKKQLLTEPPTPSIIIPPGCDGLTPLEWGVPLTKNGKPTPPAHQAVADALSEFYGPRCVAQGEDIFLYVGTHWERVLPESLKGLYNKLQFLYKGQATHSQIESFFALFLNRLIKPPVDMFVPDPTRVNFLDGTLHWVRGSDYSKWTSEFKPHNPLDYVTHVIPLEYLKAQGARNEEFQTMLGRVFQGDPDIAQKIRAVRQMYGACLAPIKPHFFLLHGPQGSGKSSLIIPAMRLVHRDNWSSVQPHEFTGFLMAPMLGKTVNFCTDLSLTKPIEDSAIKTVEDRVPVRIDRKYEAAVMAPLPALHIFAGNGIPPTLDGSSGAHTRRWTFIKMDAHKTVMGEYMQDFGNWVYDQNPHGVLAFALQGLGDLLAAGHYCTPDSGAEDMAEWGLENDPIGRFLDEARRGEIKYLKGRIIVDDGARILTGSLWEAFRAFADDSFGHLHGVKKHRFYARVQGAGFKRVKDNDWYFTGIGDICNG